MAVEGDRFSRSNDNQGRFRTESHAILVSIVCYLLHNSKQPESSPGQPFKDRQTDRQRGGKTRWLRIVFLCRQIQREAARVLFEWARVSSLARNNFHPVDIRLPKTQLYLSLSPFSLFSLFPSILPPLVLANFYLHSSGAIWSTIGRASGRRAG